MSSAADVRRKLCRLWQSCDSRMEEWQHLQSEAVIACRSCNNMLGRLQALQETCLYRHLPNSAEYQSQLLAKHIHSAEDQHNKLWQNWLELQKLVSEVRKLQLQASRLVSPASGGTAGKARLPAHTTDLAALADGLLSIWQMLSEDLATRSLILAEICFDSTPEKLSTLCSLLAEHPCVALDEVYALSEMAATARREV